MSCIVFYDPCCPVAYTNDSLRQGALGGTEATVIRVAEALDAYVVQHNRWEREGRYLPPSHVPGATHVVCLRLVQELPKLRKQYPNAKLYLWLHDIAGEEIRDHYQGIVTSGATIVGVSQFHKDQIKDTFARFNLVPPTPVRHVYNPIDAGLVRDETPVDPNKLVFFSSPHKGLEYTLRVFEMLHRAHPEFRLYVSNPGYYPDAKLDLPGVVNLGRLSHAQVLEQVRSALCVFYLNRVFPETFGLVFAEANAVGTPVLTAPIGAATEILYHPSETLDVRNAMACIERVLAWRTNRPLVRAKEQFRIGAVASAWTRLFNL